MKILLIVFIAWNLGFGDERFFKIDESNVYIAKKSLTWAAARDSESNLVWQVYNSNGNVEIHNWSGAISYCESLTLLDQIDWRLPNKNEMKSIIDYEYSPGVMSSEFFPGNATYDRYWTSTTQAGTKAWYLSRSSGLMTYAEKENEFGVMCVRGGL